MNERQRHDAIHAQLLGVVPPSHDDVVIGFTGGRPVQRGGGLREMLTPVLGTAGRLLCKPCPAGTARAVDSFGYQAQGTSLQAIGREALRYAPEGTRDRIHAAASDPRLGAALGYYDKARGLLPKGLTLPEGIQRGVDAADVYAARARQAAAFAQEL